MKRRHFLTSSLPASAVLGITAANLKAADQADPDYYELRHYQLQSGPGRELTDSYLREALIPGLNRLGIRPVGVFAQDIGPYSPSYYVLIPSKSVDTLLTADARLNDDAEYVKAGAAFLNVPAKQPAYLRVESTLMKAFAGWPTLTVTPATATKGSRVFELRTYESPTDQDHKRKVEMFHAGEFDIFQRAGFWQVFYGDSLIGPRLPNLTYMLGFDDLAQRNKLWKAFFSDPEWKKLTSSTRFSFENIVSNVTNLILSPASYSQI